VIILVVLKGTYTALYYDMTRHASAGAKIAIVGGAIAGTTVAGFLFSAYRKWRRARRRKS
jgi:hypothetical protein